MLEDEGMGKEWESGRMGEWEMVDWQNVRMGEWEMSMLSATMPHRYRANHTSILHRNADGKLQIRLMKNWNA